jgi:tetratricopeptide (TPR) repeat protein
MAEDQTDTAGPVAAAAETCAPPTSPPGYELIEEIGRGGMGVVYRARDTALDRDVAVKLLADRFPADSPAAQRFLSEARITGQLQHPGIPAVHQVGILPDGRPFLAMKLIKGNTLETILRQRPDPSADRGRLLAVFEAVCQAVGYAHAHRVIHRDLKPQNVMVGAFGEVQVMDWGLAKVLGEPTTKVLGEPTPATVAALAVMETQAWTQVSPTPEAGSHTQAGSLVGTPAYMAPEQALGEIDKVNDRSDVFGLGAVLTVILTGRPPYVGESFQSVREQAARGKLDDCFARLDASGAEPELVAVCKQCLAFEPADRPADAGAVASAVAGLRTAADERARRAELEKVRVEGETAAAEARSAERRKRRWLALGAAAVLAVAVIGGLSAVLAVQRRANADLAGENVELAAEQAKVEARNKELAEEQAKVQTRFELAQKAIALFHTGVSEDALLRNAEFKELRTKLLKEAAGFYANLQKLLAGQTDARSRKALAAAYFQLGELTDKIGDKKEALAIHREALALRRELAALEGADVETRLEVVRSLGQVASLLRGTGDTTGALRAFEEQRDIITPLDTQSATDAVHALLAESHNKIGSVLALQEGKLADALPEYQKALAIWQKLADAYPAVDRYQSGLATCHHNIGIVLQKSGKPAESLSAFRKALAIRQKLADAYPTVIDIQSAAARSHDIIGDLQSQMGQSAEALQALQQALAIRQKLAKIYPGVSEYRHFVALTHNFIGFVLEGMGKREEALLAYGDALRLFQRVVDLNPAASEFRFGLAITSNNFGRLLARQKRFAEAFTALDAGLAIGQKLAEADPKNTRYTTALGDSHARRGCALVRSGQPSKAANDLRQALEVWAKDPTPEADGRFERSRALALLAGLAGEAKSGVTTVEAATFADEALASLRDAIRAGSNWPNELKEPDFDALRDRPDFQKLMVELEAKAGSKAKPKD